MMLLLWGSHKHRWCFVYKNISRKQRLSARAALQTLNGGHLKEWFDERENFVSTRTFRDSHPFRNFNADSSVLLHFKCVVV